MRRLFELINKNFESNKLFHEAHGDKISHPIITISREKGSAGRPIAYLLAKKLGSEWQVYHKEIVEEIAKETELERDLIDEIDENRVPLIKQLVTNLLGQKQLSLNAYYKHLLHILATIGTRGHAIIVGRGANFLFPNALKVRIVAERKTRIDWIMKYEKVTYREAVRRIDESDKQRDEFVSTLFQHTQRKAHHYDLVIRTGPDIDVEEATDLIVYLAKKKFKIR
jgi:cytidylate kinase